MLAETLCLLAGHPSSLFVSTETSSSTTTLTVAPELTRYLHPGEVSSLNTLADLASRYRRIKSWATDILKRGREAAYVCSRKGKERAQSTGSIPDQYLVTLANGILDLLLEYDALIVRVESSVLSLDPTVVQDDQGFVPLSTVVATFSTWQAPMVALDNLITTITTSHQLGDFSSGGNANTVPGEGAIGQGMEWTPAKSIQLLQTLSQTGNPQLGAIFSKLLGSLQRLFLTHLVTFVLHGIAPPGSSPSAMAIATDDGIDPGSNRHRVYRLNEALIPELVGPSARESIMYVGRVTATLRREGKELPQSLLRELQEELLQVSCPDSGGGLEEALSSARAAVGEWLWQNILTGPQVFQALETYGDYFLTRNGEYAISLLSELHRLNHDKILTSKPTSSSSVIREQDLYQAILRASIGTGAEYDRSLERLYFTLPDGSIRPTKSSKPSRGGSAVDPAISTIDLFSTSVFGSSCILDTKVAWPLDLFITPSARSVYSEIQAYLFALRDTRQRVVSAWSTISGGQRRRSTPSLDSHRSTWALLRFMLFFLDTLLSHFTTDIIEVQHRNLLDQLSDASDPAEHTGIPRSASIRSLRGSARRAGSASPQIRTRSLLGDEAKMPGSPASTYAFDNQTARSRVPPTPTKRPSKHLDFLTLRQIHTRHLAFLRQGLLIADRDLAVSIRDILDTCKRFAGLIERWRGSEPASTGSEDDFEAAGAERKAAVKEINETLHTLVLDFFRTLVDSQNPQISNADMSSNGTGTGAGSTTGRSFSRTARAAQLLHSTRIMSRQTSFSKPVTSTNGVKGQERDKASEVEGLMARHVEQLLLRLDFNGVMTNWLGMEDAEGAQGDLLAEGGVQRG